MKDGEYVLVLCGLLLEMHEIADTAACRGRDTGSERQEAPSSIERGL